MALIADANTMITNGPTAATTAKAIAAAGPIIDYAGSLQLYLLKVQEVKNLLNQLKAATDAADPNLTTINTDLTAVG